MSSIRKTSTIVLPRLAGSSKLARALTEHLSDYSVVEIDFRGSRNLPKSFITALIFYCTLPRGARVILHFPSQVDLGHVDDWLAASHPKFSKRVFIGKTVESRAS